MKTKVRVPPGPRGYPLVGSAPFVMRHPLRFYRQMTLDYGDISHTRMGRTGFYVVNESSLIEDWLVGQHKHCVKDAITRTLYPLVGRGLLTSEGEPWKRQRKLAAPPFSPKRISGYGDVMVESSTRLFAGFRDGEVRDFHADIMTLTLEIVGKTILGVSTREESDRIARAIDVVLAYLEERLYSWTRLMPFEVPTASQLRFRRAKAELDDVVRTLIARSQRDGADADHLIARLSRARTEDGEAMTAQQLHDEALTMLLAGHETTALALMYSVYALSEHPAAAGRLREEIDAALGTRPVTVADLPRLPYLDACMREALRLYPPAYAFGREVVTEFELGGYVIPVGSQIITSPYGMHRNPRHFPEPDRFKPERWLDGSAKELPRFAYLPFGGGPRVCIGNHFAMMELGLVLATLMQQLELAVVPGFELSLAPVITLRSRNGLPVRVQRRAPAIELEPAGTKSSARA